MTGSDKKSLGKIIYKWLSVLVLISFCIAALVGTHVQNLLQKRQSFALLGEYIDDVEKNIDINGAVREDVTTGWAISDRDNPELFEANKDNDRLERLVRANPDYFCELSIADNTGTVVYSSDPDMIGYDLKSSEDTKVFMSLFDEGVDYYAVDFASDPFVNDRSIKKVYAGTISANPDYIVLFGINENNLRYYIDNEVWYLVSSLRIGKSGFLIGCFADGTVSGFSSFVPEGVIEEYALYAGEVPLPDEEGVITETIDEFYGQVCYVSMLKRPKYYVVAAYPVDEANELREEYNALYVIIFLFVLVTLFILIFLLIRNHVVKEISIIHRSLKKITGGDLEERADAEGSREFRDLSAGINDTVADLKERIQAAKEQMAAEMEKARKIQESAVPTVYPENDAFELYASMDTAEAVGGDFYDFFMRDDNTLVIVMADVSGKGMPAALYMMRAKTLINTYAEQGLPVEKVAECVNLELCKDKTAKMFVTAWIGFLDLSTGVLSYVHAGHTFPVLMAGGVSFVKQKINTVLGGVRKAKYIRQEISLAPGDSIYLYTDGVTEARDANGDMYESSRLLTLISQRRETFLSKDRNSFSRVVCEAVLSDVRDFARGAEQYDDITMMCVRYKKV